MIQPRFSHVVLLALACFGHGLDCAADSVTVQCESGVLGAEFLTGSDAAIQYISISTPLVNAEYPGNANRVATFSVNLPAAGTYDLYARVRVGAAGFDDDSLFYGNGFGTKSPTMGSEWIRVNGLASGGFTGAAEVVAGEGTAGSQVWKWVNLSQYIGSGEAPLTFTVLPGDLVQTFQIGAREDGLAIDRIVFGTTGYIFTVAELDAEAPGTPPESVAIDLPPDLVLGNLIQFSDNGAWCWYQDERAVIDQAVGRIITGSVASGTGTGGAPRDAAVDAVVFDLDGRFPKRTELASKTYWCDDHNAPAFVLWPDGRCTAQYAGHNQDFLSRFRVLDGDVWQPENAFDWSGIGAVSGEQTSYSNPYYLAAEGRAYTFVRCIENRSPHFLVSSNSGGSWEFGGQLVEPDGVVGYNSGYFRYSGNGVDRIDFICTEGHPRDLQTSIYHGYISNGMSFRSDGAVVDTNLFDTLCPVSRDFTLVFSNGTVLPAGMTNYRCWNSDVQRYADGSVQALIHARINNNTGGNDSAITPNHAFFFCRFDGTNWATTYLCQAGTKMYSSEADYVGLGALSPNDPSTIFLSTRYDPRVVVPGETDTNAPYAAVREIWKGVTTNHGASFTWVQITQNSVQDNFRPIVPVWNPDNIALLWFRGTYNSAQNFDTAVVGLVEQRFAGGGLKSYVDANTNNTRLATGETLETGDGAGLWHLRSTLANGGDLLASADVIAEDAPALETTFGVPGPGRYDVWVNFWGNPVAGDWRIKAGLATNQLQVFRQMASESVDPAGYDATPVLTNGFTNFLYQAYLGRVAASVSNTVSVFVDDHPIVTGTTGTIVGDLGRTWFDGVSFARVGAAAPLVIQAVSPSGVGSIQLTWNSQPPESLLAPRTYSVQRRDSLQEADWETIATGIPSEGTSTAFVDTTAVGSAAFYRISTP